MIVLWGEDYEEACARLGPHTHADLATARATLAVTPGLGNLLIEGSQLYEIEVTEAMGLFRVRLAYSVEPPYVILWDVQALE